MYSVLNSKLGDLAQYYYPLLPESWTFKSLTSIIIFDLPVI